MKKIGLCLSGGGSRGAYQIGALQALDELGILPMITHYSGTSIGAANSALVASTGVETAKKIWFNVPEKPLKSTMPFKKRFSLEYLKSLDQGILDPSLLEELLTSKIDFENMKSKNVHVTISNGGTQDKGAYELIFQTFKHFIRKNSQVIYVPLHLLDAKEIVKAVLASCAIPVIFPAVKLDDKKYYDGGLFDNIPVEPLALDGCEKIIIIHLNKIRFFDIKKWDNIEFFEIKSKKSLGPFLKFSNENSHRLYEMGHADAINFFDQDTVEKLLKD